MTGTENRGQNEECRWFRSRLRELVSGTLAGPDLEIAEDHLLKCQKCSEEWNDMVGDSTDLTGFVMDRIGADPCQRAMDILAEPDGSRLEIDEDLLTQHLEHCGSCAEVEAVVSRLQYDLPFVLDMEPDVGFLEGVIASTSQPAGRLEVWPFVRQFYEQLVRRPRIAMEVAYVVSLFLFVALGVDRLFFERVDQAQNLPTAIAGTLSDFNTQLDRQLGSFGGDFYGVVSRSLVSASSGYQHTMRNVADLEISATAVSEIAGAVTSRLPHLLSGRGLDDKNHERN